MNIPNKEQNELSHLMQQKHKAIKRVEEFKTILLSNYCPFYLGDQCEVNTKAHNGKTMRITSIVLDNESPAKLQWHVVGRVLKKSGQDTIFKAVSTFPIK